MIKKIFSALLLSCVFGMAQTSHAETKPEYKILTNVSVPSFLKASPNQTVAIEFFSYGCPHCYHLFPAIDKWMADNKAKLGNGKGKILFRQVPVAWNDGWQPYMTAYEVAHALGQTAKFNDKIFTVAQNPLLGLANDDQVRSFFTNNGVTAEHYDHIVQSPAFAKAVDEDKALLKAFSIMELPAMIVIKHHKIYYFSNATLSNPSPENFIAMLNKLLWGPQ